MFSFSTASKTTSFLFMFKENSSSSKVMVTWVFPSLGTAVVSATVSDVVNNSKWIFSFGARRRDRKIFAMAGIWEDWLTADGSELDSCAIVTTAANETLAPIHQRMPVILEQSDWDTWLDVSTSTKAARALLKPAANDLMEAIPITTRVNKVSEDDASLLEPVELVDTSRKMPKEKDKDQLPLL